MACSVVGRRYAMVDDLKAKIAEACDQQNPHIRMPATKPDKHAPRPRSRFTGPERFWGGQ